MPTTLEQRTLSRARQLLGSTTTLARVLVVPEEKVKQWLEGSQPMPISAFLRTVDVVNDGGRSLYSTGWSEERRKTQ